VLLPTADGDTRDVHAGSGSSGQRGPTNAAGSSRAAARPGCSANLQSDKRKQPMEEAEEDVCMRGEHDADEVILG
jgi:hypothetical protein